MTLYRKLVRDRVPEIIMQQGKAVVVRAAAGAEFEELLRRKFYEEAAEFFASPSSKEMADVLEVLLACADFFGFDMKEAEEARKVKLSERGGFSKRIVLDAVESAPVV